VITTSRRSAARVIEGPYNWRVRPVAVTFVEREAPGVTAISGLAGAIWTLRETSPSTPPPRAARDAGARVTELRLGLTWAFAL
jgi:hypothetical protein